MNTLSFFDLYVNLGLMPIAVFPNTKKPVSAGWNQNWSVQRWRPYFEQKNFNMGILLGDIVDVEGDTEEANDLLERMIDGAPCPRFRSSKSIHHLFLNPDPTLTRCVFNGIEFRGRLHQSVVPPSHHENGTVYNWLIGSTFPIPKMPEELFNFYKKNKKENSVVVQQQKNKRKRIKDDFTRTKCNSCKGKFYIHKKRLVLEVQAFRTKNLLWMCRKCREFDLRKMCKDLRKNFNPESLHVPCNWEFRDN
jgi:hypothetical protein